MIIVFAAAWSVGWRSTFFSFVHPQHAATRCRWQIERVGVSVVLQRLLLLLFCFCFVLFFFGFVGWAIKKKTPNHEINKQKTRFSTLLLTSIVTAACWRNPAPKLPSKPFTSLTRKGGASPFFLSDRPFSLERFRFVRLLSQPSTFFRFSIALSVCVCVCVCVGLGREM